MRSTPRGTRSSSSRTRRTWRRGRIGSYGSGTARSRATARHGRDPAGREAPAAPGRRAPERSAPDMTPLRPPRRDFWLSLGENLRIAVRALRANKMRTVLTIIGNVVAVMSVIAVVSIIDGVNTYVSEKVLDQGLRVIYIDKFGLITDEDEWRLAQRRSDLTLYETDALRDRMRLARRVVGQVETNKGVRSRGTELKNVRILGTTEGYPDVGKYEMAEGRELEENDFERRRPVAVIGSEVSEKLFPHVDPIGQSVRVSGHDLRVVGVLAARGNVLGQSQDNLVVVPMGQFNKMYGARRSFTILVSGM